MYKPFCISNISFCNLIFDIQLYNNFIFYFDQTEFKLIKYKYDKFNMKTTLKIKAIVQKFIILNEEYLALIHDDYVKILKNFIVEKNIKLKEPFSHIFYDEKLELFYIFFKNSFNILDAKLNAIYAKKK